MPEVLATLSGPAEPWTITTGPDGTLTVTLAAPVVVTWEAGGSDTLAAATPAPECPLDPGFRYRFYATPGDSALHVARESATISGDYAVLGHLHQHQVALHQPGSVGGGPTAAISFLLDGGGEPITEGVIAGSLIVPYDCTIVSCTLLADVETVATLDIKRDDYASYPTAASICGGTPPSIGFDVKSQDTTLSGWTTSLSAGDILQFYVEAVSVATTLTIVLLVTKA